MDNANHVDAKHAIELPDDFVVRAIQSDIVSDGQEAQKGSKIAADKLLDNVVSLKGDRLFNEILKGLQAENWAKVKHDKNGEPTELSFDKALPGYPKSTVTVDISKGTLNQKDQKSWEAEAAKERSAFVDAKVDAKNRPKPEGRKNDLSKEEKETLRKLEKALVAGDLDSVQNLFQSSAHKADLWKRVVEEVNQDIPATNLKYRTAPDGNPYLAVIGDADEFSELDDLVVVPAKGAPSVIEYDNFGEPDFGKKISRTPGEVMASQTGPRQREIQEQVYYYRCDFDKQEKAKAVKTLMQTLVEKYNGRKTHACGPDSID